MCGVGKASPLFYLPVPKIFKLIVKILTANQAVSFLRCSFKPGPAHLRVGSGIKYRERCFFAPCHHLCSCLMTRFNGGPLTGVDLFLDNFFWLFYFPLRSISSLPKLLQNLPPGMAELSIEVERLLRSIQPVVPKL